MKSRLEALTVWNGSIEAQCGMEVQVKSTVWNGSAYWKHSVEWKEKVELRSTIAWHYNRLPYYKRKLNCALQL